MTTSTTTPVQGDDLVPGHGDLSYGVSHYDLDLTYRHVGNHLSGRRRSTWSSTLPPAS